MSFHLWDFHIKLLLGNLYTKLLIYLRVITFMRRPLLPLSAISYWLWKEWPKCIQTLDQWTTITDFVSREMALISPAPEWAECSRKQSSHILTFWLVQGMLLRQWCVCKRGSYAYMSGYCNPARDGSHGRDGPYSFIHTVESTLTYCSRCGTTCFNCED